MHLSSSRLTLAATDLGRFLACRHLTALDIEVAFGRRERPKKYPDPFLDLLIARGFAHEKGFLKKVEAEGAGVLDIGGIATRFRKRGSDSRTSVTTRSPSCTAQGT